MRLLLCLCAVFGSLAAMPAVASTDGDAPPRQSPPSGVTMASPSGPFDVAAVADTALATSVGTGRGQFRLTDDIAAAFERQAGALRVSLVTIWTMEVAGPVIAANARDAGLFD